MNFLIALQVVLLFIRIDGCKSKALNGFKQIVDGYYFKRNWTVSNSTEFWTEESIESTRDDSTQSTLINTVKWSKWCNSCLISSFSLLAGTNGCVCHCSRTSFKSSKVTLKCENLQYEDHAATMSPLDPVSDQTLLEEMTELDIIGLSVNQILKVLIDVERATNLKKMNVIEVKGNETNRIIFRSPSLESLEFRDSQMENLAYESLANLSKLQVLAFTDVKMKDLPDLSKLIDLKSLYIISNELESLRGTLSLPKLIFFSATENSIRNVSDTFFDGCPELRTVTMENNRIEELTSFPVNIQNILLKNNLLQSFYFKNSPTLENINIEQNKVESLPGTLNMTKLVKFNANNNEIRYLSPSYFRDCDMLQEIYLNNNTINNLTDVAFPNNVEKLSLAHNNLEYIGTNLNSRSKLKKLFLQFNYFTEIPENCFPESLTVLDLSNNKETIVSFPNTSFIGKPPSIFNLSHNNFLCSCELQWIKDIIHTNEQNFQNLTCQGGMPFRNFEFCPTITITEPTSTTTISPIPTTDETTTKTTWFNDTTSTSETSLTTISEPNTTQISSITTTEYPISTQSTTPTPSESPELNTSTLATESPTPTTSTNPTEPSKPDVSIAVTDLPVTTSTAIPNRFYDGFLEILNMIVFVEESFMENETRAYDGMVAFSWNGSRTAGRWRTITIKHKDVNDSSFTEVTVDSSLGYYSYAAPQGSNARINCIDIGTDLPYNILGGNCFVSSRASAPVRLPNKDVVSSSNSLEYLYIGLGALAVIVVVGFLLSYQIRKRVKEKPPIFYPVPRSLRLPPVPPRRTSTQSNNTYISTRRLPAGNFVVIGINHSPSIPRVGRISPYTNLRRFYTNLDEGTLKSNGYIRIIEGSQHIYESIGSGKFLPKSLSSRSFSTKFLTSRNLVNKFSGANCTKSLPTKNLIIKTSGTYCRKTLPPMYLVSKSSYLMKKCKIRSDLKEFKNEFFIREFYHKLGVVARKPKKRGNILQKQLEISMTASDTCICEMKNSLTFYNPNEHI